MYFGLHKHTSLDKQTRAYYEVSKLLIRNIFIVQAPCGQSFNLHLMMFFSTLEQIAHLWQPKTAIFLLSYCYFSLNKSCRTYMRPMMPPDGRNWQLIYTN